MSSRNGNLRVQCGPPVLLVHGLFMVILLNSCYSHFAVITEPANLAQASSMLKWFYKKEMYALKSNEIKMLEFWRFECGVCFPGWDLDICVKWHLVSLFEFLLFMKQGGDAWFLDSTEESLGFILADYGFDVWVANVRGTHWSHGHVTLSEKSKVYEAHASCLAYYCRFCD